ncbi:hypothetical protein B0E48_12215 [Rhodanobacter sp. C03]|nr:hypothetical protein B0E48_12215 [Rhodanobacter sp. C03]
MLAFACCTTAACSQSANHPASNGGTGPVAASAAADDGTSDPVKSLDCDKLFTTADVAGILESPIELSRNPLSNGCTFENERVAIQVWIGKDTTAEMSWNDVTASPDSANFVDLPGVGDQARRRASNGFEVLSRKGKLYCFASRSSNTDTNIGAEALAKRLGALCNKVFAVGS